MLGGLFQKPLKANTILKRIATMLVKVVIGLTTFINIRFFFGYSEQKLFPGFEISNYALVLLSLGNINVTMFCSKWKRDATFSGAELDIIVPSRHVI